MIRTGIGYDVHQFAEGRPCILGGVEIPHTHGLAGHSDADVLSHAIADAILGALGLPDIGHYFPPGEESCKDICSLKILEKCAELAEEQGYLIGNIDSSLVAEAPKVLPHAEAMKENIAKALTITPRQVGIKATTNETMGFVGRKEGIAALASSLLVSREASTLFASQKESSTIESKTPRKPFSSLDPEQPIQKTKANLPHWFQPNAAHFITWRTHDSMPKKIVQSWVSDREQWLRDHNINPTDPALTERLNDLPNPERKEYYETFNSRWQDSLDECFGSCPFRDEKVREILLEVLNFYDGVQYWLGPMVIMPNHIHFIVSPMEGFAIWNFTRTWKNLSARKINAKLGRTGRFWQIECYDHVVRSERALGYFEDYIERNPEKAGLGEGEFYLNTSFSRGEKETFIL